MLTDITGKILPGAGCWSICCGISGGSRAILQHLCPDAASGIFEDKKVKDEIDGLLELLVAGRNRRQLAGRPDPAWPSPWTTRS